MTAPLQKPTADDVRAACRKYDKEHGLTEQALEELIRQYPRNGDVRHVLLKVVAVNSLSHTHVFDVEAVARHIHGDLTELDAAMASGSPDAVRQIAQLAIHGKQYNLYSFATKYCCRHNPTAYAAYDLRVEHYLCSLHKVSPFASFSHADLCNYPKFLDIMTTFRDAYGLGSFTFQQIGKFLAMQTEPPALPVQEEIQTGPGTFDFFPAQEGA